MSTTRSLAHAGLDLAYDYAPGPKMPVILLHGGGQNRHSWGAMFRKLEERGHEVISLDHRGHGDSSWADGHYSLHDYATDVDALVAEIGRPCLIVGASLGGLTGLLVSIMRPDAVSGLVLVDITTRPNSDGTDKILGFMNAHIDGFADLDDAVDAVGRYLSHRPKPPDRDGLRRNLRQGADGRWRWHWDPRIMASVDRNRREFKDLEDAARQISVPVLIVRGEKSDVVTDDDVTHFLSLVPHADVGVVEGAHHMVAGDRNDSFADVIMTYLDDHASWFAE